MIRKFLLNIIIVATAIATVSCNKDSDAIIDDSGSVAVTSFSLSENEYILSNLDSVYFSIDLNKALIYNADSLPYGTNVTKLVPVIVTDGSSVAELHIPRPNGQPDSVINYITNSTDSVDFSNGPVTLHLVSQNGDFSRDYKIHVNVHQVKPDSLYWNKLARKNLPSKFGIPNVQKTVKYNEQAVCLTKAGNKYCIATSDNPGNNDWQTIEVTFPFTPDVESLNATDDALYILDANGKLYKSTDGISWEDCNATWSHIYGGYGTTLLGVEKSANWYNHVTYPASEKSAIEWDFPVAGTSQFVKYDSDWSESSQVIMIGGLRADGATIGDTWGYDGSQWAKISSKPISLRSGMALFSYYTYKTDTTTWSVSKHPTLIAIGGYNEYGYAKKDVFISLNQGINWKLADDLMQLPDYIPEMGYAQALVFPTEFNARSTSEWEEFDAKKLPFWWQIERHAYSRASQAITKWDCPYIYLFGGRSERTQLYNTVWRGVINRLMFKPVQ